MTMRQLEFVGRSTRQWSAGAADERPPGRCTDHGYDATAERGFVNTLPSERVKATFRMSEIERRTLLRPLVACASGTEPSGGAHTTPSGTPRSHVPVDDRETKKAAVEAPRGAARLRP